MTADNPPPTPPTQKSRWWVDALWLAALAVWTAGWCLTAAPKLGTTYDEPFYLDAGLESWRGWSQTDGKPVGFAHELAVTNGVMPLPLDALALPLYIQERQDGEMFDSEAKIAHLRWARAMTLGWFWLLIGSAWRLGRAAGGPWAGRIASGLIATDPNFLAHASLATTDIAISAALMGFAHAVYVGRGGGWWRRILLPGLWFGVAALCKLSGLLYGGIILVGLEVCHRFATEALSRQPEDSLRAWAAQCGTATVRSVLAAAAVIVIGSAVALLYCGFPHEGEEPFKKVAAAVPPDEPLKPKYLALAEDSGRTPHAVCAFAFQWWWNSRGRPTFLNGSYYPEGYRWFFPELLLMKLPLPIFLLGLAALLRPRAVANPLTLVSVLLLAVLLRANLQIGLRLALPVVAMIYVALATALGRGYLRCSPVFALPAILAIAITSVWVWPHGLGYLNQLHGGREAAPSRVSDSNLDWGQGLPELKAWHEANGKPHLIVWYFGTDPAVHKPPFQRFPLEALPIQTSDDLRKAVGPQILAVGYTVITLHPDGPPAKVVALNYLKTRQPLARTATFVLYDFRDEINGPPPLEQAWRPPENGRR